MWRNERLSAAALSPTFMKAIGQARSSRARKKARGWIELSEEEHHERESPRHRQAGPNTRARIRVRFRARERRESNEQQARGKGDGDRAPARTPQAAVRALLM